MTARSASRLKEQESRNGFLFTTRVRDESHLPMAFYVLTQILFLDIDDMGFGDQREWLIFPANIHRL